jgi:hypothetical protein
MRDGHVPWALRLCTHSSPHTHTHTKTLLTQAPLHVLPPLGIRAQPTPPAIGCAWLLVPSQSVALVRWHSTPAYTSKTNLSRFFRKKMSNGRNKRARVRVAPPAPRNILFITADQFRADCLLEPFVQTPFLDSFRHVLSLTAPLGWLSGYALHLCSLKAGLARGMMGSTRDLLIAAREHMRIDLSGCCCQPQRLVCGHHSV